MLKTFTSYYTSPIGAIEISATEKDIVSVLFVESETKALSTNAVIEECKKQLDEYFHGDRKDFSLPYILLGTDFQKATWNKLKSIEYGKTMSYAELAEKLNSPKSARAVGSMNGKNVILIILPCHRIIGQDGSLTGYAGGLWRKKWLLEHERKVAGFETQLLMRF
ncbi:MAG TPA: methylated-DNA--[protein]-cysteine S-methyltransferase [Cytophagaceae bacterium]|jgi:methylated-DNA-[protein]-cysteine S-methyltransferase|nr:methylated-DNA--[protein]-cysteine S-methyltransferase [Cytophagaceae bacterium]